MGDAVESPVNKLLAYNYDKERQQIAVDHLPLLRCSAINFYEAENE